MDISVYFLGRGVVQQDPPLTMMDTTTEPAYEAFGKQ